MVGEQLQVGAFDVVLTSIALPYSPVRCRTGQYRLTYSSMHPCHMMRCTRTIWTYAPGLYSPVHLYHMALCWVVLYSPMHPYHTDLCTRTIQPYVSVPYDPMHQYHMALCASTIQPYAPVEQPYSTVIRRGSWY
eukprot:3717720-Rhodomonas_salina.6